MNDIDLTNLIVKVDDLVCTGERSDRLFPSIHADLDFDVDRQDRKSI